MVRFVKVFPHLVIPAQAGINLAQEGRRGTTALLVAGFPPAQE
jgi:hypothetical protein